MMETEPYKVPYGLGVGQILFGGTSNISIVRAIVQHFEERVHTKSSSTDQVCNCKRSVTFASMLAKRLHQIARNEVNSTLYDCLTFMKYSLHLLIVRDLIPSSAYRIETQMYRTKTN